jgi:ABC-2 type transport system permease protein
MSIATTPPAAATTAATAAAEWLKLRSVRSTWWFVGGATAVMLLTAGLEADAGGSAGLQSLAAVAMTVINFVQYILLALGIVAITNEFANRSITVTVMGTPSRIRVMLAKALVVGGAVFAAGMVVVLLGVWVLAVRFDELGLISRGDLAHLAAMGSYLSAIAVIGLGLGTVVRRTAGTMAILVLLLLLVPEILALIATRLDAGWIESLGGYTPGPAGYRFIAGEWQWGLVLLAWAVAALTAGVLALRTRDV